MKFIRSFCAGSVAFMMLSSSPAGYTSTVRPMDDPRNAKLKLALERCYLPANPIVHKNSSVILPKQTKSIEAIAITNLTATTDLGGHVSTPGPRGNWHTTPNDAYIALPSYALGGRRILVRSRKTGKIVELPVYDTGPWATNDNYLDEIRRPRVERGISNIYRHVPRRAPSVDISPAGWIALDEYPGSSRRVQANYSSLVDIIIVSTKTTDFTKIRITKEIVRTTDIRAD